MSTQNGKKKEDATSDIVYCIAKADDSDDMENFINMRLETVRAVNNLPEDYVFEQEFIKGSSAYFKYGNQLTVFAKDKVSGQVIGCASLCYTTIMPTLVHFRGRKGRIMNVYVKPSYRRKGIGYKMIQMLIDGAKVKKLTEINLETTEDGKLLYKKCGFEENAHEMALNLI